VSVDLSFALLDAYWTTPGVPAECASVCLMPAWLAVSGSRLELVTQKRSPTTAVTLGRWASAWRETSL